MWYQITEITRHCITQLYLYKCRYPKFFFIRTCQQRMELENTNNENSSDPTPTLKSNPEPILFISFNQKDRNCFNCGNKYTTTFFFDQKYCKRCLSQYITKISDNNTYLDMCIITMNLECIEHEMRRDKKLLIKNIQEWCENCSQVSYFKQMPTNTQNYNLSRSWEIVNL